MQKQMNSRAWTVALGFLSALTLSVPSIAQDDEEIPDLEEEVEEEDSGSRRTPIMSDDADDADVDEDASEVDADAPTDGAATDEASAGDADIQTIYVAQGKQTLVGGRFELSPQIAQSVNDRFTSHTGLLLSGIYHLKENVAFELSVGSFFWWDDPGGAGDKGPRLGGRDTDMTIEIRQKERLAPELVQLYRLTWLTTADLQWSPIYGKVAVQGMQLGQFNVYLSVGAGVTGLQLENQQDLQTYYPLPNSVSLTTTFGGGLRFYFGDFFGVRFEVRDYVNALSVLQQDVPSEPFSTFDVTNTVLAQLGVSFLF